MMLETTVDYVNRQFPWATEDTVQRIAELSRSNNVKTVALAAGIQKVLGAVDAKRLESYIKDAVDQVNNSQRDTKKFTKDLKQQTQQLTKGVFNEQQGIEAMTNFANAAAQSLDKLASDAGGFLDNFGRLGQLANRFANGVTGTAVAFTSVGVIATRLISEQEKQVRSIMDLGVVLGDVANYTTMRGQLASIGMTMGQYNELLSGAQHLLTQQPGSLIAGSGQLLSFLSSPSTQQSIRHFGYAPAAAARALTEEAIHLFELNQINELNEQGQQRAIDSFRTVNDMAIFMAENFGVQRSALLEQRRAARENVNFRLAMFQQRDLLEERYGEGASQRVQEAYDWLSMLAPMLGEEFGAQTLDIFGGTLGDLQLDESVVNNMLDDGFKQRLQLLGPDVFSTYESLIRDSITGRIPDRQTMITRFTDLARQIRESDPRLGTGELFVGINDMIARATLIPQDILEMSNEEIESSLSNLRTLVDGADDAINIVGDLATSFLEVQHQITPGFETMSGVMHILETSVGSFADFWIDLFGDELNVDPTRQRMTISDAMQQIHTDLLNTMTGGTVSTAAPSTTQAVGESLQQQITRLESELETAREDLAEIDRQIAAGDDPEANRRLLAELRTRINTLTEQRDTAQEARDAAAVALRGSSEALLEARNRQTELIGDSEDQFNAAQAALEQAQAAGEEQGRIAELEASRDSAREEFDRRSAQAQEVQVEIDRLTAEHEEVLNQHREASTNLANVGTEIDAANLALTNAQHDTTAYRLNLLRQSRETIAENISQMETSLETAREQFAAQSATMAASPGMGGLLDFISQGEGGYESSNRGTQGNRIIGSTHTTSRNGRALTEMTLAEVMRYQSLDRSDPNRLFAVGRYQIIPSTMQEAVAATGIDVNRRFDQATQDELGIWLVTGKRPAVGRYIRGESDDLMLAMEQLALEFASFPVPRDMIVRNNRRQAGQSAYGSGNRASHSIEEVRAMLERARAQHAEQQAQAQAQTPDPATVSATPSNTPAPETDTADTVAPQDASLAQLQEQERQRIAQINALTGDPGRLNTATGDVNTTGLDEETIRQLAALERQLQTTLREIADLQSRQGAH